MIDARSIAMKELYMSGSTLQEIGVMYFLSRERVRQILTKNFGFTGVNGGREIKRINKAKHIEKQKEEKLRCDIESVFGCSVDEFFKINGTTYTRSNKQSIAHKYLQQKNTSKSRGIDWKFNFLDWWRVWEESGKWGLRGRGQGYCMARKLDLGPYEKNNVYICTIGKNSSDSYLKTSWADRFNKREYVGKLKTGEVRQIKKLLSEGIKGQSLAKRFNISKSTISAIKTGKRR